MLYRVTHHTTYKYSASVSLCQNLAHLTPRNTAEQHCRYTTLVINPRPAVLSNRPDYFGNQVTFFAVQEPHRKLSVTASHVVQVAPRPVHEPHLTPSWEVVRDRLRTASLGDRRQCSRGRDGDIYRQAIDISICA